MRSAEYHDQAILIQKAIKNWCCRAAAVSGEGWAGQPSGSLVGGDPRLGRARPTRDPSQLQQSQRSRGRRHTDTAAPSSRVLRYRQIQTQCSDQVLCNDRVTSANWHKMCASGHASPPPRRLKMMCMYPLYSACSAKGVQKRYLPVISLNS